MQYHPENVQTLKERIGSIEDIVRNAREGKTFTREDYATFNRMRKVSEDRTSVLPEGARTYYLHELLQRCRVDKVDKDELEFFPKAKEMNIKETRKDMLAKFEDNKKKRPKLPK